jgi:iron complex outermembrane recepter protein
MMVAASALGATVAVAQETLSTIEVVGVSPAAGSEIDIDKVPSDAVTEGPAAFSHTKTPDLFQAMMQGMFAGSIPGSGGHD